MRVLPLMLIAAALCLAQALPDSVSRQMKPKPERFRFALIGDQQYTPAQEPRFERVVDAINAADVRFTVHDGDIIGSGKPCDDATFAKRVATFGRFRAPFVLTPGDNDWTDCWRPAMGGFDPLERLATVRRLFYPAPGRTMGRGALRTFSQGDLERSPYIENLLWAAGEIVFATVHVVGSNNNWRDASTEKEFRERDAANIRWMRSAFALARQNGFRAVVLIIQANPHFEQKKRPARDGFEATLRTLEEQTLSFTGPVVLVHGDSHYFRIDKPLVHRQKNREGALVENFTRVETFGPPDGHWVRATVDPRNPALFTFEPVLVPGNIFPAAKP